MQVIRLAHDSKPKKVIVGGMHVCSIIRTKSGWLELVREADKYVLSSSVSYLRLISYIKDIYGIDFSIV